MTGVPWLLLDIPQTSSCSHLDVVTPPTTETPSTSDDASVPVGVVPPEHKDKETCGHALTSPNNHIIHSHRKPESKHMPHRRLISGLLASCDGSSLQTIKIQSLTAVREGRTQTVGGWGQSVSVVICLYECTIGLVYWQVLGGRLFNLSLLSCASAC